MTDATDMPGELKNAGEQGAPRLFIVAPGDFSLALFNIAKHSGAGDVISFSEFVERSDNSDPSIALPLTDENPQPTAPQREIIVSAFDAGRFSSLVERAGGNSQILIVCASPEERIGAALFGGLNAEEEINRWCDDVELILSFADVNPRRCTIVCGSYDNKALSDLCAFVEGRYGAGFQFDAELQSEPPQLSIAAAVAALLMLERPRARATRDLLEARSFPIGYAGSTNLSAAALDEYKRLISINIERDEAVKAAEILRSHLHSSQFRLEARFKRAEKALTDAAQKRIASLEAEKNALAGELASLKSSIAWRLTAPLRIVAQIVNDRLLGPFRNRRLAKIISQSSLFDADWYAREYKDIAARNIDPALHYVRFGGKEGRAPGPNFNGAAYIAANPDLAGTGVNPLLHYILHGEKEGRPTRPRSPAARPAGA
ncbi:MAG TPA: hypothetical protein PKH09_00950 [Parvularculaceae bacterium]|nr:hypothetical protein [Parvularculaceae bacterium]